MTITLEMLIESGVQHAQRILIEERKPRLSHFYHLVSRDGKSTLIPVAWENEIQKQLTLAGVRAAARTVDAVMAMGIAEGWALHGPPAKNREQANEWMDRVGPPSESPQRQEVVMIFATDGERTIGKMVRMQRDKPGGRIVALVPDEFPSEGTFEGRLIDVLPKRQA